MKKHRLMALIILLFGQSLVLAQSQYFGQNKPRYKKIDFHVLQSPHFELYHYFDDRAVPNALLIDAENWYKQHQQIFKMAFIQPNPLIVYKNHPDFQETTAIGGQIGEGTGGVTEGLRNRVVMPIMYTHRQTDHVLGHELVHAFQYQTMTYGSDSTSMSSMQNLPLFMVEGLAEYMSLGREDSHTAMWMRDAVLNNDIPTIEQLVTEPHKYFPYRWGQAFWAYATATYGDDIIRPLFKETAKYGMAHAFKDIFKKELDLFSAEFKTALLTAYNPLRVDRETTVRGKIIASETNSGEMNLSPAISPDGNLIAYISSKNVLSMDILIADANSGKLVKKISGNSFSGHIDAYNFIETAGSWSPDSKNLAIVIQSKGKNKLSIINTANGRKSTFSINGVDAFSNPAWSPDGNSIVVSGLMNGHSDLYLFNLKSKEVINLTNDVYSDIHPSWSPDGRYIYFSSDRTAQTEGLEKASLSISRIEVSTKKINSYHFFGAADNLNPVLNPSGTKLYFLSDSDGFRNLYQFDLENEKLNQLTNYFTGISGITMYSPALSISSQTGKLAYSYFNNGNYAVVKADESDFLDKTVENKVEKAGGILPPFQWESGRNLVQQNLRSSGMFTQVQSKNLKEEAYKGKFKLDYLANSGLGVSTSQFGTGIGGGITGLFSDMLNNNQLVGTVALSGNIQNFGGQVYYINQKKPLQFGASLAHIPYQFYGGSSYEVTDTLSQAGGIDYYNGTYSQIINRLYIDQASFFAFKPFSKAKRFEFGAAMSFYSFSLREYPQQGQLALDAQGNVYGFTPYNSLRSVKLNAKDYGYESFNLKNVYAALVGDQTTFGTVAPLNGYRYRFEIGQYFGTSSYTKVLADVRKYHYLKPFTLAGRFMYNGRLSPTNTEVLNNINPLFLGYPWYMHGFYGKAYTSQQGSITQQALSGEQMALANFELRLPFTGPKKIALIPFPFLPSDLNFYVDAGMVWSKAKRVGGTYEYETYANGSLQFKADPVVTTGLSLRVNVLGYLIIEPYMAVPFYNGGKKPVVTGMNFMIPGW